MILSENTSNFEFDINELLTDTLGIAIIVVGALIVLMAIFAAITSFILAIKYIKYNHKKNSAHLKGKDLARLLLDKNGLEKIKVKATGSLLFGNSYSHYFKKIRLRRLTWKKESLTSLAMASQKVGLAVLDKEGDKDMKQRIILTPLISFGPLAFVPILLVGVAVDIVVYNTIGTCSLVASILGLVFMVLSFFLQLSTLKTEIKGQKKAYEMLEKYNLATEKELEDVKKLFKLYNIEYVNNIIISFLEILYRVLVFAFKMLNNSKVSTVSNK